MCEKSESDSDCYSVDSTNSVNEFNSENDSDSSESSSISKIASKNKDSNFSFIKLQNFVKNNFNVCYANSAIQSLLSCGKQFFDLVIYILFFISFSTLINQPFNLTFFSIILKLYKSQGSFEIIRFGHISHLIDIYKLSSIKL